MENPPAGKVLGKVCGKHTSSLYLHLPKDFIEASIFQHGCLSHLLLAIGDFEALQPPLKLGRGKLCSPSKQTLLKLSWDPPRATS